MINIMIKGTKIQQDLITFKENYSHKDMGKVGASYTRKFKRMHADYIISRRGHIYKLERASWTTYLKLHYMYHRVYKEMAE